MQQGSAMKQHVRLNIHTAGSTGPPSPFFRLQRHLTQSPPLAIKYVPARHEVAGLPPETS
ncbi:hypothetical protein SI91_11540 [Akkermansia muciniphila]|nr:hypothetical protein [Akkermansia muciniphila]MCO6194516.1 hypothetical protein [Akkermansia muciniphila]MCO6196472.1 hypothetical protein [Akkermansia muciniphila]MCO6198383.1 hypothetical protein [Akkermansia muciniphila]OUN28923.1 hypothetical protein B5G29_03390 [Akkermansia muciniphila]